MSMTVNVDTSNLLHRLRQLAAATKVESSMIVKGEARQVARDLMKITPPFGLNGRAHMKGKRAVARNYVRAVRGLRAQNWRNARIKKLINEKDNAALEKKFRAMPGIRINEVRPFRKELHRRALDNRYRARRGYAGKTATTDWSQWHARLHQLMGRVGYTKSTFKAAFLGLGGVRVQSWIRKHQDTSKSVFDGSRLNSPLPMVTLGSRAPAIRRMIGYNVQRVIRRAENRILDKTVKVVKGHAFDWKTGVVRIHRPAPTTRSA